MAGVLASFNQLDKRQQIMVVVGIPVVIIGALGYFAWGMLGKLGPDPKVPAFMHRKTPSNLWGDINATDIKIAEQVKIINEGPEVDRTLKSLKDQIALAEERLPLDAETTEVRQLFDKLARDISPGLGKAEVLGVRIIKGGVVKGQDYLPITYNVDITGDYNGIIKFVDSIEKNTRFMMVKTLSLKPGALSLDPESKRVVSAPHTVNLEIVSYVYTAGQKPKGK
jgi:Tfp pilus assembly protein PilO